jgi:hypothetical protein
MGSNHAILSAAGGGQVTRQAWGRSPARWAGAPRLARSSFVAPVQVAPAAHGGALCRGSLAALHPLGGGADEKGAGKRRRAQGVLSPCGLPAPQRRPPAERGRRRRARLAWRAAGAARPCLPANGRERLGGRRRANPGPAPLGRGRRAAAAAAPTGQAATAPRLRPRQPARARRGAPPRRRRDRAARRRRGVQRSGAGLRCAGGLGRDARAGPLSAGSGGLTSQSSIALSCPSRLVSSIRGQQGPQTATKTRGAGRPRQPARAGQRAVRAL